MFYQLCFFTKVVCTHETIDVEGYLTLILKKNPFLISGRQPEVLRVPASTQALPEII